STPLGASKASMQTLQKKRPSSSRLKPLASLRRREAKEVAGCCFLLVFFAAGFSFLAAGFRFSVAPFSPGIDQKRQPLQAVPVMTALPAEDGLLNSRPSGSR